MISIDAQLEAIQIRGARTHNLKSVDLDIPHGKFVVMTGPSGSGKSSLAFDTLFAEGQRQYLETLSASARQFIHQLERPDVDEIDGLAPTICIDQRPTSGGPRSTVATVTEIHDFLRVLMARLGEVFCPQCGAAIAQQPAEEIESRLMAMPEGTKLMLLAPIVRGRRGAQREEMARIRKAGFVRVRIDGELYDIEGAPTLAANKPHTIEAVVDRIVVRPTAQARLAESLRLALEHGEGVVVACHQAPGRADWTDDPFSTRHSCPVCQTSIAEIEPRTFSFNSPYGACPRCEGLGVLEQFDPERILPDASFSLAQGALAPWRGIKKTAAAKLQRSLTPFLERHKLAWEAPLSELDAAARRELFAGDGQSFLGVITLLEKELATAVETSRRDELLAYRTSLPCLECGGARLRPEGRSVKLAGKAIHEITALPVEMAGTFFASLAFPEHEQPIAEPLAREISQRLSFLDRVGVGYLTLDRGADTLSGGERQRVRLATGIGSGLAGVCYVLDEPSIGLHPRDNQRLIDALRSLQAQDNTVLVVEHDEAMMRQADLLIDMGPGAGAGGGRIVAQGAPAEVEQDPHSLTGQYLSGARQIAVPKARRPIDPERQIVLEGATAHNLKEVSIRLPLSAFVCVTGVSGSGKSSLINETLAPALIRALGGAAPLPGPYRGLSGVEQIDRVTIVDQSPLGRTPRSIPATYLGMFDDIRKAFAATRESRRLGFRANRFSFNVAGGRCEACQGQGARKIEMGFLPDLHVTCETCRGARYNRQTLQVRFRGRTIAEVLAMSADEIAEFFANIEPVRRAAAAMIDVGLGYLPIGQPATTLSGGEAQRIRLAAQLARPETGRTLCLFDEPTTGLHFDDIHKLLAALGQLVDLGNTVVVIEHHLDVIKCADWVIDLGPEGGAAGGRLVAQGGPEEVAAVEASHTGRFLRETLRGV